MELAPFCRERALLFHEEAFKLLPFQITESYRSQERQYLLFTQNRSEYVIENLYQKKLLSEKHYKALKEIYKAGKNLKGRTATWTLSSKHMLGRAFDVRISVEPSKEKLGLALLDKFGDRFGVFRPKETLEMGDYGHFEVFDTPYEEVSRSWLRKVIDYRIELRMKYL